MPWASMQLRATLQKLGIDAAWVASERPAPPADDPVTTADGIAVDPGDRPNAFMIAYLRAADGIVRQQALVDAHDLSAASVSRRLQQLEADGRIERYAVGRENIVCLPDRAPDAIAPSGLGK